MNIEPCNRCHSTPIIERFRSSFWRVRCVNHTSLLTGHVVGHPMKTQKKAVEVWNLEMTAAIAKAQAGAPGSNTK